MKVLQIIPKQWNSSTYFERQDEIVKEAHSAMDIALYLSSLNDIEVRRLRVRELNAKGRNAALWQTVVTLSARAWIANYNHSQSS